MDNVNWKPSNAILALHAALVWIALFAAEGVASYIFKLTSPTLIFYCVAAILTALLCLAIPLLGKNRFLDDIQELCLYDAMVQFLGAILHVEGVSNSIYLTLAQTIFYLKMLRLAWIGFEHVNPNITQWPAFGPITMFRQFTGKRVPVSVSPALLAGIVMALIVIVAISYHTQKLLSQNPFPITSLSVLILLFLCTRRIVASFEASERLQVATQKELSEAIGREQARNLYIEILLTKTREIEQQKAELEAKNRALDEYARQQAAIAQDLAQRNESLRDASHDVKQPITKLRYYTDRALLMVQDEAQRPFLQAIETGLNDVSRLMHSVIDQAKANTLLMKPPIHPIAVADLVDYFERNFAPEAQAAGIFFEQRSEDCMILSNEVLLKRIISNLVDNAIRHGQQGTCAKLRFYAAGKVCHIRIMDRGPGIVDANGPNRAANFVALVARLKKEQADPAAMPDSRHGLGLISVLRVCDELGITLQMRSTPEQGTVFHFTVPLASKT